MSGRPQDCFQSFWVIVLDFADVRLCSDQAVLILHVVYIVSVFECIMMYVCFRLCLFFRKRKGIWTQLLECTSSDANAALRPNTFSLSQKGWQKLNVVGQAADAAEAHIHVLYICA